MNNPNYQLTTTDIRTLRNADSICFDYLKNHPTEPSRIRAIKDKERTVDGFEQVNYIPCNQRLETYHGTTHDITRCFAHFGAAKYYPELITIWSLLKPGDILVIWWVGCNNSQYLDKLGAARDECRLIVKRKMKSGKVKQLTFLVDSTTTDAGSTARMIKWN